MKANSVGSEFDQTAVKIVNLYTQENTEELTIYRKLNKHLCKPGENYSDVWDTYAQILSNAIDVLSEKEGVTTRVYRGDRKRQAHYENDLCFKNFVSTSTNPKTAQGFANFHSEATFFDIYNATGVQVHKFSQFASEKEVLLKKGFKMAVTERVEGDLQIKKKLENLDLGDYGNIKLYLTGRPRKTRKRAAPTCVCFDMPGRSASVRINPNLITAFMLSIWYLISKDI